MSSDTIAGQSATNGGTALGVEATEHERQFRETLELCPAGLLVMDEDGRLLYHNARLREILAHVLPAALQLLEQGEDLVEIGDVPPADPPEKNGV